MTAALGLLVLLLALIVGIKAIRRLAGDSRAEVKQVLAAVVALMLLHVGMKLHLIFPHLEVAPEYLRLYWNLIDAVNLLVIYALVRLVARKHRSKDKPLD